MFHKYREIHYKNESEKHEYIVFDNYVIQKKERLENWSRTRDEWCG